MSEYTDKKLICRDCKVQFTWTAGEQEFFAQKGFTNPPTRCPECRKKNRGQKGGQKEQRSQNEEMTKITCKNCGKTSEAPFKPKNPANILCAECFEKQTNPQK